MRRPPEADLQEAVDEAECAAIAEGLKEPTAITEYCVQHIMRRIPDLDASAALAIYRRLRVKG
jgi:hypothetical protein